MNDKLKEEIINEVLNRLNEEKTMYVEKLSDDVILPKYSHEDDAAMDIHATEDILIKPGETVLLKTGLKVVIPANYELDIRPRSGLSIKTKLRMPNSIGTIDAGFRAEMCVIFENTSKDTGKIIELSDAKKGDEGTYSIKKGDRIAQMMLLKYEKIKFVEIEDINEYKTTRSEGFGGSGI